MGVPIAGRKIEEALQSGLDDLDAAAANSYLQLSQSLTAVQIEQADQVLQIEGLQTDLKGKSNFLARQHFDEKQAGPAAVLCCGCYVAPRALRSMDAAARRAACPSTLCRHAPLASVCMLPPAVCLA